MNFLVNWLTKTKNKLGIIGGFLKFLWARKLWWLIPIFMIILLIGLVLVLTQGTAIAPFIYTLF